ncbi:MAG: alkaline phosphatase family protein [Patescibacteria group bacterium]|nr:alkaline phosphatase family protein [Patescibacteria group bacterium]
MPKQKKYTKRMRPPSLHVKFARWYTWTMVFVFADFAVGVIMGATLFSILAPNVATAIPRVYAVSRVTMAVTGSTQAVASPSTYVIYVSVDGLRPDAVTNLGPSGAPNFYRLMNEGAYTLNARNDYDITVTLPNHVSMVTSRPINGTSGHNWTSNSDPAVGQTIHSNKGGYVAGVFDVAHDNGLRTAMFASKTKFSLFDVSYNAVNGAPDATGADNGRDKIDVYVYNSNTANLTTRFISDMTALPYNYSFIHYTDADTVGHASGWNPAVGSAYSNTIKTIDGYVGQLLQLISGNSTLNGNTTLVISADHGGTGTDHSNATLPEDYTIPMFVWGKNTGAAADLYALNTSSRENPGTTRPTYSQVPQPIRNSEAGNLALYLMALPPIPGSVIDASQDLATSAGGPTSPSANAGPDQSKTDNDNSGAETFTLDGTGSYDPDGAIVAYEWNEAGTVLATTPTFDHSFTTGSHSVYLTVTDNDGLTSLDTAVITVNPYVPPPPATTIHVGSITMTKETTIRGKKTNCRATAAVTILNQNNAAVRSANVTGQWSGSVTATASLSTNRNGTASFRSPWTQTCGIFTFTVNGITLAGYVYEPTLNGATSGNISF